MNNEMSSRIRIVGFFMTCAMVFYHCPVLDASYSIGVIDTKVNEFISYMFTTMGGLVMSYFFAVTGFLLFHGLSFQNYFMKMKRRIFSLLIPYILWQCIITILNVCQQQYVFSLNDFLSRTFGFLMWPEDGAIWYLYAVFYLALLSPIFLVAFKNKKIGWGIVLCVIIFCEARGRITNPLFQRIINHGYVGNILYYFPSYLVGCFYGKFSDEKTDASSLKYVLSLLWLSFVLEGTLNGIFYNMSMRMMPLMILFLVPIIPKLENIRIYSLTFLIYVMHQPLIGDLWPYLYDGIYTKITLPVSVCNIITKLAVLGIDVLLAYIIHTVLKRTSPKTLKLLTGGRF